MTETLNFESILLPGIEAKRPLIMAGPCSAETEEQVLETAKGLANSRNQDYFEPWNMET